jgi:hypothetical protein
MANQTIGDWDQARLAKFIQQIIQQSLSQLPGSMTLKNVTINGKLTVNDEIEVSPQAKDYIHNL